MLYQSEKISRDRVLNMQGYVLPNANAPHDKETIQRQIDTTDRQIDKLVYELYGLSEEEINIVEGNI